MRTYNFAMEEKHKRAKEVVSYNTALLGGKLNITCMEATLAMAERKEQVKLLERRYLAGTVALNEELSNPAANEDLWSGSLDKKLESMKQRHVDAMKRMDEEAIEEQKKLQKEIGQMDQRIRTATRKVEEENEALETAKRDVPTFDPDTIGDIAKLKRNVEALKQIIERLEKKIENFNERKNDSIRDILSSSSPRLGGFRK